MHPNAAFRWDNREALRTFAAEIGFGMLFAQTPDGPRVAHVPFVFLGEDRIGFHIARGNGIAKHLDGTEALLVVNGPDAYISPDWYRLDHNQVPTWNYLALELEGPVRRMTQEELVGQVDAVTAEQERRHTPKPQWTRDKMDAAIFDKLTSAIIGFELRATAWRGTAKLGQNKPKEARANAADALDATGQKAMAHLMRNFTE